MVTLYNIIFIVDGAIIGINLFLFFIFRCRIRRWRRQRVIEAAQNAAALKVYREEQKIAHDRAENLLISYLTPEQKEYYQKNGYISAIGNSSGRAYVIGYNGIRVQTLDHNFCAYLHHKNCPGDKFPRGDHLLGMKILIENDEQYFISHANSLLT